MPKFNLKKEIIKEIKKANGFDELISTLKLTGELDLADIIESARWEFNDLKRQGYKFSDIKGTLKEVFKSENISSKYASKYGDKSLDKILKKKLIYLLKKEFEN